MQTLIWFFLLILLLSCQTNAGEPEAKMRTVERESMERELKDPEMEMDSEANRRVLWGNYPKRYISYAALRGDSVPCSRPGVPYYNCGSMPKANPYTRDCEIITLCARDFTP